ncbi:MAG: hypothetical protein MUC34_09685 [Anaerolineae bacterium]|nr:hypothetical protein [Anaerolineae bacterium]
MSHRMRLIYKLRRFLLAALIVLLAAVVTRAQAPEFGYWDPSPLPIQGLATYYNPGIMEYVQTYRLQAGDIDPCPECVGSVALLRAGDIGRKVWLQPPGGDPVGPFLVVDCARRQDVLPLLQRNWAVDVSFEVGQYWGMNRPLDGVIVFEDPADAAPGGSTNRIPTPFAVAPSEVVISPPTATPEAVAPAGFPTPWPTRMPYPLAPGLGPAPASPAEPTSTPVPPTPTAIWPPPLTPIITTPTVIATPAPAETLPAVTPVASATEVALGRAGGDLLAGVAPVIVDGSATAQPFPTARPTLARTPRPNLTPILPAPYTRTPTPTPDPGLLDRILRELLDLVR